MQRAGNRRYYRPEDVALAKRIDGLLNREGYTVKGVQKLLAAGGSAPSPIAAPAPVSQPQTSPAMLNELRTIRDRLAKALAADDVAARI